MNQPNLNWVGEPPADNDHTTARGITYAPQPFGWGDMAINKWIFDEYKIEKPPVENMNPVYLPLLHSTIRLYIVW